MISTSRMATAGRPRRSRPGSGAGSPPGWVEQAHLVVVVQRDGRALEHQPRSSTRSAGGPGQEKPQIVQAMRRSWITGALPNIDARRRPIAVHPARASSTRSPGWVWMAGRDGWRASA